MFFRLCFFHQFYHSLLCGCEGRTFRARVTGNNRFTLYSINAYQIVIRGPRLGIGLDLATCGLGIGLETSDTSGLGLQPN